MKIYAEVNKMLPKMSHGGAEIISISFLNVLFSIIKIPN